MSLLDDLRAVSERLGIVEVTPAAPSKPAKIETRTVTLSELQSDLNSEEIRALADLPAELSVDFAKVFEAAGIRAPAHGWDAERLKAVLRTDAIRKLEVKTAQTAVLNLLALDKVPVEDVVKDVIARDQALDAFEAFARQKMEARRAARERRRVEIEAQVAELRDEAARMTAEDEGERARFRKWLEDKRGVERELAWAVGHLIDRPVVTIDEEPKS